MGAHQDQMRGFAKYNREFNLVLYGKVAELEDDERMRDMGAFFGSIHGTLNHILLADRIWLGRFAKAFPGMSSLSVAEVIHEFSSLSQEVCSDFDGLLGERKATDRVITDWAEELTDELLAQSMRYNNSTGQVREHPVWVAAAHMFNHQTHHRGQVTTLLSQLGYDPGVTDYFAYAQ
ncbi:MAG: DinB family protein [Xanthomonadales bacterium]|nr:DinB family protein [Xanthomonadales bacterium]